MCIRDCPNDVNEAVSSLVFASARCGDLPELRAIRKLFGERYGDSFIKGALELCPVNLVNSEVSDAIIIHERISNVIYIYIYILLKNGNRMPHTYKSGFLDI